MARYRRRGRGSRWGPYVPVAARQAAASRFIAAMVGEQVEAQPVVVEGRQIAGTFWGRGWCDHLEGFSDYENRLPRGRTYVRNGAVCHLEIAEGEINAFVMGRALYEVSIRIDPLRAAPWRALKRRCAGRIGSLIELLQGRLSDGVMAEVSDPERGLFPRPKQIHLSCSCPDWAVMCKHVAAVLYGVGARLDEQPELLFVLRGVDQEELIDVDAGMAVPDEAPPSDARRRIAEEDLGDVFGIELSPGSPAPETEPEPEPEPGRASRSGPRSAAEVAGLRRRFGMTQAELALLLDVTGASISNWERSAGPLRVVGRVGAIWPDLAALTPEEARLCLEVLAAGPAGGRSRKAALRRRR